MVEATGMSIRSDGGDSGNLQKTRIGGGRDELKAFSDRDRTVEVMIAAAVTVVMGVANRVLYKLALVPLKHYPFFLAQLATFGYTSFSSILHFSHSCFFCLL